jgi:hypothetical protein
LDYDPTTGIFRWRVTNNGAEAGAVAGHLEKATGRRVVIVAKNRVREHRLAWLHYYGRLPTKDIDHIDGNPANNRISNLREASMSENLQNQKRAQSTNRSGYLGVSKNSSGGGWSAVITANGKKHRLGTYRTPEEAHAAYLKAKRELHPFNTL